MSETEQAPASGGVETDELLALAKAALPGEWEADYDEDSHTVKMYQAGDSRSNFESHHEWKCEHGLHDDEDTPEARGQWEEAHATACYLAACSPERIIAILTELTALRARVEAAERVVAGVQVAEDWCGLHRTVEVLYVADDYEVSLAGDDGATHAQTVSGVTLADAFAALTPSPTPTRTEP